MARTLLSAVFFLLTALSPSSVTDSRPRKIARLPQSFHISIRCGNLQMMSVRVCTVKYFWMPAALICLRHLLAALHVHPEDVVGDEDVRRLDRAAARATTRSGDFSRKVRLVELPDRAEVALERAAARGLHQRQRLAEVDVVVVARSARSGGAPASAACRGRGASGAWPVSEPAAVAVEHAGPGTFAQVARRRASASTSGGMTSSPSPIAMTSIAGVAEPVRIARGVVPADDHEGLRHLALARARARRMVRLRSVVKLHCRPTTSGSKRAAVRQALLLAVDAEVDDLALVPVLPRGTPATQIGPSGSTKVSISRPRMPPIGRLEEGDFHGGPPESAKSLRMVTRGRAARIPRRADLPDRRHGLHRRRAGPPAGGGGARGARPGAGHQQRRAAASRSASPPSSATSPTASRCARGCPAPTG